MANKKADALTDMQLKRLKRPDVKKWVRDGNGLALCLTPTDRTDWRQWYFIYTSPETGKRRYYPLGTYTGTLSGTSLADARKEATKLLAEVKKAIDPLERQRREMEAEKAADELKKRDEQAEANMSTVAELVNRYIEKHAKLKKSSWQEDQRILNKDVLPVWGDRKAKDITRREVIQLLEEMQGRGDGIITNTFKIIRRMFAYAVKQEIISVTPCYAFEKGEELPQPVSKERNLSESETKVFWTDLDNCAISEDVSNILRLILLTSQRPGEVCSMHSSEIDGRWWEFTPKQTEITKEIPRKQRVYLTDTALALIGPLEVFDEETNKMKPRGYIFKCHTDNTRCITERAVSCALRRNLLTHVVKSKTATWKKTRTKPKRKNQFIIPDNKKLDIAKFTPHDLRRTCATMLSGIGFTDAVVDAVLAHLKKGEIRTYNKNKYDKEKQEALVEWELKMNSIVTGEEYRTRLQREADIKAAEEADAAIDKQRQLEEQVRELTAQLHQAKEREAKSNNVIDINQRRIKAA